MSLRLSSLDPNEPRAAKGEDAIHDCALLRIFIVHGLKNSRLPNLQPPENQVRQVITSVQEM